MEKAFRMDVGAGDNPGAPSGTIVVTASNAKDLESKIRVELSRWRVKFSNRAIKLATKKAMKLGKGYIGEEVKINQVCPACYGSAIDFYTGEPCEVCNGTGLPVSEE